MRSARKRAGRGCQPGSRHEVPAHAPAQHNHARIVAPASAAWPGGLQRARRNGRAHPWVSQRTMRTAVQLGAGADAASPCAAGRPCWAMGVRVGVFAAAAAAGAKPHTHTLIHICVSVVRCTAPLSRTHTLNFCASCGVECSGVKCRASRRSRESHYHLLHRVMVSLACLRLSVTLAGCVPYRAMCLQGGPAGNAVALGRSVLAGQCRHACS